MGIDDLVNKVNLDGLVDKAKELVGDRDMDDLKEDAAEVLDIAKGDGSITDKAKDAIEAVKDPGAPGPG